MAENTNVKGKINSLTVFHTDAYNLAVQNGYKGTIAEWLKSLEGKNGENGEKGDKGDKGEKGDTGATGANGKDGKDGKDGISPTVDIVAINGGYRITITDASGTKSFETTTASRLTSIALPASAWTGDTSPYSQVVAIDGVTEYTKVDLLPSVDQLAIFHNKDLAFVTENEDGVVTVYAIGDKPTNDYTIQASLTEVNV